MARPIGAPVDLGPYCPLIISEEERWFNRQQGVSHAARLPQCPLGGPLQASTPEEAESARPAAHPRLGRRRGVFPRRCPGGGQDEVSPNGACPRPPCAEETRGQLTLSALDDPQLLSRYPGGRAGFFGHLEGLLECILGLCPVRPLKYISFCEISSEKEKLFCLGSTSYKQKSPLLHNEEMERRTHSSPHSVP